MWLFFRSLDSGMTHSIESIAECWEGHGQSRRYSSEALSKPNSPWKYPKFHSFCVLRQQCIERAPLDYMVGPPTSYCFCNFRKPGVCSCIQCQGMGPLVYGWVNLVDARCWLEMGHRQRRDIQAFETCGSQLTDTHFTDMLKKEKKGRNIDKQ